MKRPGWTPLALARALTGRSHRSPAGRARLKEVIERSRSLLGLPEDYRLGLVPGSDTGAVEMALWSLLGQRGVDVLAWENFGACWARDVCRELRLADVRVFEADYGELPDLAQVDCARDIVFTWNGTASGVWVPHGEWIRDDREGLTICDATSAVFAVNLPWRKLDVVTWSWQKVMGGEAAHGMLALSPRALARLRTYTPPWPLPKLFRMVKDGAPMEELFEGVTLNTPSLLAVEDQLDALRWAESIGGLPALVARTERNFALLSAWVARTSWVEFLARREDIRSHTAVCLALVEPWFTARPAEERWAWVRRLCALLEEEQAAFDIAAYRTAPPGLRIWCGATVEAEDLERLLPWLDWAYAVVRSEASARPDRRGTGTGREGK